MTTAIADWRNIDAYPKWGKSSLTRFAWEFLRRNPEYQKDWEEYVNICRNILPTFDPRSELAQSDFDRLEDSPEHYHYEPERINQETEEEWLRRVKKGKRVPLHSWYGQKWGLRRTIHDPLSVRGQAPLGPSFKNSPQVSCVTEHWDGFKEGGHIYVLHPRTAIGFDLSLPIDAQIEEAYKYLLSHQKYLEKEGVISPLPNKIPRREWVIYLRLLDAQAAGVTVSEMAAYFYPDEENTYPDYLSSKKIRTSLVQAKKWRDSWYRYIPSLHPPKKK